MVKTLDAKTTAVIVTDMWNKHTCKTSSVWADTLAMKLSAALGRYRRAGIPIIWMNGDVYRNHVDEVGSVLLAKYASAYGKIEPVEIPALPVGLPQWYPGCPCSDGTCLAVPQVAAPWSMMHPRAGRWVLDLVGDWIMHLGFLAEYGIETVLYAGLFANICVLNGRSFSLWQTMAFGYDTILLGDLTVPFLPDMGFEESLDLVLDYYRGHICSVCEDNEIVLVGHGAWPHSVVGDATWGGM